jgi:hypothetical protein
MLPGGEDGKRGRAENHLTGLSEGIPKDKLKRRDHEYEHEGQERELAESGWRCVKNAYATGGRLNPNINSSTNALLC